LKGISSILGAVILAAIVFTVLIPLLIFLQNTTTLYHLQVLERHRAEIERFQENLEIHATISPDNHDIYLLVRNKGSLAVNLTNVYIADSGGGLTIWNSTGNSVISPLSPITPIYLNVTAEEDKAYTIHAATERGRSYAAVEKPLNITDPPYILQVTVLNMKYDRRYLITVEVADWMGLRLGCVAGATSCNETSSLDYYASTWNENQTFFFKLLPGNYTVAIRELEWNGATWEKVNEYGPRNVLILDNAVTIFRLPYNAPLSISDIEKAFTISIDAPSSVFTKMEGSIYKTVTVNIGVNIGLIAAANESLRDLRIKLEVVDYKNLDGYNIYPCGGGECEIEVEKLRPGDNKTLNFRLELNPTDNLGGGYVVLRASLVTAKGEMTGKTYGSVYSDDVAVSLCKFTEMYYIKCVGSDCDCPGDCTWHPLLKICICETSVFPRCDIPD